MTAAYDFIKAWAKPGEFTGWFDISIKPPIGIHILINIKEWGPAIGRLAEDSSVFICSLPHVNSPVLLDLQINSVTHWAVIPEIKGLINK